MSCIRFVNCGISTSGFSTTIFRETATRHIRLGERYINEGLTSSGKSMARRRRCVSVAGSSYLISKPPMTALLSKSVSVRKTIY